MADEFVGPYQIPQLLADENVARVSHSKTLAAAINAGLAKASGDAVADANTKYGALPARITAMEARELPDRGRLTTAVEPGGIDTVTTKGSWAVWTGADATALGLPTPSGGQVKVFGYGNVTTQKFEVNFSNGMVTYSRQKAGAGAWSAWSENRNTSYEARLAALETPADTPDTLPYRTAALSLTLGRGTTDAQASGTARYPMKFNAPINRFRVHIVNINPRVGPARTDAVTINGMKVGIHTGNGSMSNGLDITGPTSIPAGQSEYVSPWRSHPIGDGREMVLTLGYTATSAPYGLAGGGWLASDPTQYGAATPAGIAVSAGVMPFQVWLEVETPAETKLLAGFGDSLTVGQNATLPVYDSWLSQHCRTLGALPVHYAASGDSMSGWTMDGIYKWTQWDHLDRPDAVVWAMGSNDVFTGATLADLQSRHATVAPLLSKHVSPTVYAATITPRTSVTGAMEDVRRSYNTWLRTLPNGVRDVFEFSAAISANDETILPEYDADGTHLNTAGYKKLAAAIGYQLVSAAGLLISPNGTRYRITVSDAGQLTAVPA